MSLLYIYAFTAYIISFVVGTALTWSSPEKSILQDVDDTPFEKPASDDEASWISAFLPLGAIFGPFIYGYLADKVGRKYTILSCGIPFVICYVMLAFGKSVPLFYTARFIAGLGVGGVFTVIPMYIAEISEDSNRGTLGSILNCFVCFGVLFSYGIGPYVSVMVFNIILLIFPAVFMVLFFLFAPESPHYHISKQQHDSAMICLQKVRSTNNDNEAELAEIQKKLNEEGHGTFIDIFKSRGLIKALAISVGLVAFQQLSGINAVLFYAQSIFKQAGTTLDPAICSIIIGGVQFGTSFVTPVLADRLGRKILLIFSAVGMVISEVPLGVYSYLSDEGKDISSISMLPILCLVLYIITYNCGFGPLPWVVMGELFPSNVKSAASSLTAGICWLFGFIIAKFFESMSNAIGIGPSFWLFAGFCSCAVPFTIIFVIETKGKSFKEIQDALKS